MSQDGHTIKENKRSTVIQVEVIKCQCTAEHSDWMQLLSCLRLCQQRCRSNPAAKEVPVTFIVFICVLENEMLLIIFMMSFGTL